MPSSEDRETVMGEIIEKMKAATGEDLAAMHRGICGSYMQYKDGAFQNDDLTENAEKEAEELYTLYVNRETRQQAVERMLPLIYLKQPTDAQRIRINALRQVWGKRKNGDWVLDDAFLNIQRLHKERRTQK